MKPIEEMDITQKLFVSRTHHRRILVDRTDAATGSRMGGTPPSTFVTPPRRCPRCGGQLEYVLTLANDTLGSQIADAEAVSMFCCRDLECLWGSRWILDVPSIVLIVHRDAPRAAVRSELDSTSEGRKLVLRDLCEDPLDKSGFVDTDRSKLGGRPGYIQAWGDEEAEKAQRGGRGFLFQWCETDHPNDMDRGTYPFCGGVVYVFSRINPVTKLPELSDLSAFWQST